MASTKLCQLKLVGRLRAVDVSAHFLALEEQFICKPPKDEADQTPTHCASPSRRGAADVAADKHPEQLQQKPHSATIDQSSPAFTTRGESRGHAEIARRIHASFHAFTRRDLWTPRISLCRYPIDPYIEASREEFSP